jgi:hypothetical protein
MQVNENSKKVARWARKTGWSVGSHMHQGMFIVSRPDPGGMLGPASREWRVAKITRDSKGTRTFGLLDGANPLHTGAKARLQRALADHGISPESEPTARLAGVPTFPINALD